MRERTTVQTINARFARKPPTMIATAITPRLYLAGKVGKHCWRHALVPGLRDQAWEDGPIATPEFAYVGPHFVACDHGCRHGPATHGALSTSEGACADPLLSRRTVIERCLAGVAQCDVLFAYINANDCYGTVAEIEHTLMLGKYVVIAFAPGIATEEVNEFWFVSDRAQQVIFGVNERDLGKWVTAGVRAAAVALRLGAKA